MSTNPPLPQGNDLESLARSRFADLTDAEIKLLRAAPEGAVAICGPDDLDDPANDPSQAETWGRDREIRGDLIRWLCVDRAAKELVDPKGIQVYAAKIPDALDLSSVTVPFTLALYRCRLMNEARLRYVEIAGMNLGGTWVLSMSADRAKVKGDVFLHNGFRAEDEVRLGGAQIEGDLDCSGGSFTNSPREGMDASGTALFADRAVVKGSVFLSNGFRAEGEVRLPGAQIGGVLDCSGGTFTNPSGTALSAEGAVVKGSVFLRDGFRAEGEVRLARTRIGGPLDCSGGAFANSPTEGMDASSAAMIADRAVVKGTLLLNNGFCAEGEVRLIGAQIEGHLDCSGGTFTNPAQDGVAASGDALIADSAVVKGSAFLRDGFRADGQVRLVGLQIGGNLECSGGTFTNPARGDALIADSAVVKGSVFLRDGSVPTARCASWAPRSEETSIALAAHLRTLRSAEWSQAARP